MDENYQYLKDEAYKTEQALENALNEKEAQKAKLEETYKLFEKTDDELNAIFLEIESNRENTGLKVDKEYNDAYWKWKDAEDANKKAKKHLQKYDENYKADIPDVMIELKEVKQQNEEIKNELQEVKNEMKNKMQEMTQMMMQVLQDFERQRQEELERQRQEELERQRQEELERQRQEESERVKAFFKNITTNLSGQNQEKDIQFPEPVEARYITFQPKEWNDYPILRCDVYVDGQLQTTPDSRRSASSYYSDPHKTSTLNAYYGWLPQEPYKDGWLKLDLGSRQRITGIRVGSRKDNYDHYPTKLALSFE